MTASMSPSIRKKNHHPKLACARVLGEGMANRWESTSRDSIPRCYDPTAIEAFRRGLLEESELYSELPKYPCPTFEDAQAKALTQIRFEEDVDTRKGATELDKGGGKTPSNDKRYYNQYTPYYKYVAQIVDLMDSNHPSTIRDTTSASVS